MMIRENRRHRLPKLSKNLERLYKEKKCRKCSVAVTRMDFAKILGKFTKVKIQYESASPPNKRVSIPSAKAKEAIVSSPNSNARLKSNENGMVLLPRTAYNEHPAKDLKSNRNKTTSPKASNVLKENNRLKKSSAKPKGAIYSSKKTVNSNIKHYRIIFEDPKNNKVKDVKSKLSLSELLPFVNENILPSEEWCIDYFPKSVEVKDDKVYDRITAELEDLMNNDKPKVDESCVNVAKNDDFPSIMDILNDTTGVQNTSNTDEIKSTLESSDVEAMLLGNANESPSKPTNTQTDNTHIPAETPTDAVPNDTNISPVCEPNIPMVTPVKPMEVDTDCTKILPCLGSPSILTDDNNKEAQELNNTSENEISKQTDDKTSLNNNSIFTDPENVTFVIFKKTVDGKCFKTVTCTKNLKYTIEIDGKSVEFLGAPKYVSCIEDLKVLLQIVHESELQSLYVLH